MRKKNLEVRMTAEIEDLVKLLNIKKKQIYYGTTYISESIKLAIDYYNMQGRVLPELEMFILRIVDSIDQANARKQP